MNNEIKEILEYFKNYVNNKFETYTVVDKHTQNIALLLGYITNLQEENEMLTNARYSIDRIELERRIDKAIELIHKAMLDTEITGNGKLNLSDLYNILQESDKE